MLTRLAAVLLLLALPGASWADAPIKEANKPSKQGQKSPSPSPDRLLPAGSQIYISWDGFENHKAAYGQTALAKTMKGDLGKFLHNFITKIGVKGEELLAGQVDAQLVREFREDCDGFFDSVTKHGFSIGIELSKLEPVAVQAIIVMPKSGAEQKSFLSLIRRTSKVAQQKVEVVKIGKRKLELLKVGPVNIVWWSEDQDAVLAIGTDGPEALIEKLDTKKGLMGNSLYKEVRDFKEFPTWGRGYVDFKSLAKVVGTKGKEVEKLLDDLGVSSMKSLTFFAGFDGPAELSVVQLDIEGQRKGLLSLLSKKKFTLADLPPMPPDLNYFAASTFEMGKVYPVLAQVSEAVVRLVLPDKVALVKEYLERADDITGVNLKDDLFGSLGDMSVSYSVWAEGPLYQGAISLIKVKDTVKLKKSLEQAIKNLSKLGAQVDVKHSKYHGVEMSEVVFNNLGLVSYTIHKGWLAIASYPQPVQGFILRANKELPSWRPSEEQQKALEPFPSEFTGIQISDPRPTLKVLLSLTPIVVRYVNIGLTAIGSGPLFDLNDVPNAYEATRYLFPRVTITTDDGKKLRSVTRSSFPLF